MAFRSPALEVGIGAEPPPNPGFFSLALELGAGVPAASSTYTLTVEAGTFTLTGSDALRDFAITADSGTFASTGNDATLTYGALGSYTLTADSGTYTLTGQDANLRLFRLTADAGTFTTVGWPAALRYSGEPTTTVASPTNGAGGFGNNPAAWPKRLVDSAKLLDSRTAERALRQMAGQGDQLYRSPNPQTFDDPAPEVDDFEDVVQDLILALTLAEALD